MAWLGHVNNCTITINYTGSTDLDGVTITIIISVSAFS